MTLYLGSKAIGVSKIVGKSSEDDEKFGANINNFLGDVDENGVLGPSDEPFSLDLTGVSTVTYLTWRYRFNNLPCTKVIADDLTRVGGGAFFHAFELCPILEEISFASLEILDANSAFCYAFDSCPKLNKINLRKLKKVSSGSVFENVFSGSTFSETLLGIEEIFPALEEISGDKAFFMFVNYDYYKSKPLIFPMLKKISGSGSRFTSTFGTIVTTDTIWHFPNVTEITNYVWNINASYTGEIHFAAARQAEIEACAGYANKWGFLGATIYFDL